MRRLTGKKNSLIAKPTFLFLSGILAIILSAYAIMPQDAKINQRKIDKEHRKKEKKALKEYENAVKHHRKIQSKETQQMMKQTQKESRKNTPLK